MADFVPLADGAQVEVRYTLDGISVENTLWFVSRSPPIDATTLQALADGVRDLWIVEMMPFLSVDLTFDGVFARDWTADPTPLAVIASGSSTPGGNSSPSHSANVAIRVRFRGTTSETWRRNSNFIPGIPIDQVTLNTYSSTIKDGIFECYVSLIDDAAFFGVFPAWRWVTTSRRIDNAPRATQLFTRTVTPEFPSPYTAPRRKRLPA